MLYVHTLGIPSITIIAETNFVVMWLWATKVQSQRFQLLFSFVVDGSFPKSGHILLVTQSCLSVTQVF